MCQTAVTATETPTFCPKDRRFSVMDYALKKKKKYNKKEKKKLQRFSEKKIFVDELDRQIDRISRPRAIFSCWWIGSFFHLCKIWTIKKVELYTSVHISIYESCRLLLLANRQKTRDRYRRVTIHCRRFSSMHETTIVDIRDYNIKIEERLSRHIYTIIHPKFYIKSFTIDSLFL